MRRGHQGQTRLGVGEPRDRINAMLALGLALRSRVAGVAEAVSSVEPMRVFMPAGQRPVGAEPLRARRMRAAKYRVPRGWTRHGFPAVP